ncbi:MAG: S49 family peptidase, partial [Bacteroidales bacterium]|nr:S49 family peptidase [Bacteroidales bacterium]
MKNFLQMLGASILGCLLVFFVGILFVAGIVTSLVSMSVSGTGTIPHKAILQISFEKPILEQHSSNPLSRLVPFGLYQDDGLGYYDLVSAIDRAAADNRIDMIYLNTNYLSAGISQIEEIRNALKRFRTSGKPVIAYADNYSQAGYYLASVADKVFLNPHGKIGLRGFSVTARYYKGLMDELGIEAQWIRHGSHKTGGEHLTMLKMSQEEREQLEQFLQSAWMHWTEEMAEARQISVQTINRLAEQNGCSQISEALSLTLIDQS